MDHYEALGISPDSSVDDIRRAYLAAARVSHPDFHAENEAGRVTAQHRMRDLNLAWECLSDPDRRRDYDARREGVVRGSRPAPAPPAGPRPQAEWRPHDPSPDPGFDERNDRPLTSGGLPGWLRLAPVLTFVAGVSLVIVGGFVGLLPVVAFGLFSLLASVALFVVAPLVALTSSSRGSRPGRTR